MQTLIPPLALLTLLATAPVHAQQEDDWNLARLPGFSDSKRIDDAAGTSVTTQLNRRQEELDVISNRQLRRTDSIQDKLRCDIKYRDTPTVPRRPHLGTTGTPPIGRPAVNVAAPSPIRTGPGC